MMAIYIILGIFIYLTIGVVIIETYKKLKPLNKLDDFELTVSVLFFPIAILVISANTSGKKISKMICNFHRKYTYNNQQRNSKRI
jgi:hypothetical protein